MEKKITGAGILFVLDSIVGDKYIVLGQSTNGVLELFGGHIDKGEGPLEAAVREAIEEFGLNPGLALPLRQYILESNVKLKVNTFMVYFVKVPFFDVNIPNAKARERLDVYRQLDNVGRREIAYLVEMEKYHIVKYDRLMRSLNSNTSTLNTPTLGTANIEGTSCPLRKREKEIFSHPEFNINIRKIYNINSAITLSWI